MNYRGIVSQIGGICAAVVLLASCSNQNTSTSFDPSIDPRAGGGCTSIMVGRQATTDGSVITSHTCDGFYRTWMAVSPHRMNSVSSPLVYAILTRLFFSCSMSSISNL